MTLMGPTASGKTAVAVQLTHLLGGVLFSADSRQVYRGMDLGTGKDLDEYLVDGVPVPYYMIDICDAGERYNIHQYQRDFYKLYNSLPPEQPKVLCGGSGLYVETILGGYQLSDVPEDEELRQELNRMSLQQLQEKLRECGSLEDLEDPHNKRRLIRAIEVAVSTKRGEAKVYPALRGPIYCIYINREVRRERITARLRSRLEGGMIEEVEHLLEKLSPEQLIYYGLEYKYVTEYVIGQLSREEMFAQLEVAIHQFAKRQMTWIRGMERRGFKINYIQPQSTPRATAELILAHFSETNQSF